MSTIAKTRKKDKSLDAPRSEDAREYLISDLSREFDVTLRALRFYEDRGLLSPRRIGTMRLYSVQDRARLSVILKGKQLGFTLAEIQEMLDAGRPAAASAGIDLKLSVEKIDEQIAHLEAQKAEGRRPRSRSCARRARSSPSDRARAPRTRRGEPETRPGIPRAEPDLASRDHRGSHGRDRGGAADAGRPKFELWDLRVEVTAPEGAAVYCGGAAGRLLRAARRDAASAPRAGLLDLLRFAALLPLLPAKQRDTHPNDWMSDRRRGRLPGPELPDSLPNHPDGQAPLQPCRDQRPFRSPDAAQDGTGDGA